MLPKKRIVTVGVEIVLAAPNIVCSIIDVKNVMLVDAATFEQYMIKGDSWLGVAVVQAH